MRILSALILFISLSCQSQVHKKFPSSDELLAFYKTSYNNKQFDAIYELYSLNMKSSLGENKHNQFYSSLYENNGTLKELSIVDHNKLYDTYHFKFQHSESIVRLKLNEEILIDGMIFRKYAMESNKENISTINDLKLPFNGEWFVHWGGDNVLLNYHYQSECQKFAFDFVIKKDDLTYNGSGRTNEDYYAFGEDIISPVEGKIFKLIDGIEDNNPGKTNKKAGPGNVIYLQTKYNELITLAHFKNGSILVKEGETVKQGQVLGKCGNSGNSTEPHLHFQIEKLISNGDCVPLKAMFQKIKINQKIVEKSSPLKVNL